MVRTKDTQLAGDLGVTQVSFPRIHSYRLCLVFSVLLSLSCPLSLRLPLPPAHLFSRPLGSPGLWSLLNYSLTHELHGHCLSDHKMWVSWVFRDSLSEPSCLPSSGFFWLGQAPRPALFPVTLTVVRGVASRCTDWPSVCVCLVFCL